MKFKMDPEYAYILDDDGRIAAQCPSDRLSQTFFGAVPYDIGLLPPAVRWIAPDGTAVIVERPPTLHTITYVNKDYKRESKYTIPVPWTIYALQFRSPRLEGLAAMRMFVRPTAIGHMQDALFPAMYPNVYGGSNMVCASPELEGWQFKSMLDAINTCISSFWSSVFNNELSSRMRPVVNQYGTLEDYFAWLEGRSIEQALEDVDGDDEHILDMATLVKQMLSSENVGGATTLEFLHNLIVSTK